MFAFVIGTKEKELPDGYVKEIHETICRFCTSLASTLQSCYRDRSRFIEQHTRWLISELKFNQCIIAINRAERERPRTTYEKNQLEQIDDKQQSCARKQMHKWS